MRKYLATLTGCRLFSGMSEDEILKLLGCMKAAPTHFKQSAPVLRKGDILSSAAIVLDGSVTLSRPTISDREEFQRAFPGDIIGLTNAFLPDKLDFTALADTDVDMLFLSLKHLLEPCPNTCGCHLRMIRNLTFRLAGDAKCSSEREQHLCRRSTRDKLLSYLISESSKAESDSFDVPLDRKELAEYLAVDRCAMSSELSKMRAAGLIDFTKNHFIILKENKKCTVSEK